MGWLERKILHRTGVRIIYTDPLYAGRHPFQTFMLALCVLSGLPLLAGRETAGSIEATLPDWLAFGWGLSLVLGAFLALIGSHWRGQVDNGLLMERIGLDITGLAAVCYTAAIVTVAGVPGLVAAAIVLGFGASCLTRARDIARIFHTAANGDDDA